MPRRSDKPSPAARRQRAHRARRKNRASLITIEISMDDKRKLVHRGLLPGAMLHDAEAIALALKSLIDIKSASRITALLANRNRMVENLHDSTNQGADK